MSGIKNSICYIDGISVRTETKKLQKFMALKTVTAGWLAAMNHTNEKY